MYLAFLMEIINKKQLPKPTVVLDTYWKFACERQNIFFNRLEGKDVVTKNEILLKHKFTNVYRASDRVSQYLIKNIIYKGSQSAEDMLFRILLFKIFNKIQTWELFEAEIGEPSFSSYNFKAYNRVLNSALNASESIYSGAYIMASGKSSFGYERKHENHLKLLEKMFSEDLCGKILRAKSLEQVFRLLLSFPTIGPFLAYQYSIDINYSPLCSFSEMDFVVPGPGARDGLRKCFASFGGYTESDLIHYVTDLQEEEFCRLGLKFKDLWGRKLHLIDCQNLFCETDKYARAAHPDIMGLSGRKRIKQVYRPVSSKINLFYPPKWGINELIVK